jgi:hypothetical protein
MMQPMVKRGATLSAKRLKEIHKFVLQTPNPNGLRPIKQVKLYKNFRPYVPHQYWEDTCPKPSDEVLESVRKERADKRKKKTAMMLKRQPPTKERKNTKAAEKK